MFTLVTGRHVGGLKRVLQHGGSKLGSVILCGIFLRISQLWDDAHALNLENRFLYLLSTISQFFWLCPLHSFWFYFLLRDSAHTLFTIQNPMLRQVFLTTHCYFILNSCLVVNLKSEQIVYINLLANGKRKVVSIQGKVAWRRLLRKHSTKNREGHTTMRRN